MKYFKPIIIGLVCLVLMESILFCSYQFSIFPSIVENSYNLHFEFCLRRVRTGVLETVLEVFNESKVSVDSDEALRNLGAQIYLNYGVSGLPVAERTSFILEVFSSEQSPVVHEFLSYLQQRYDLDVESGDVIEIMTERIIEKEFDIKQRLSQLSEEESLNIAFAIDIIFGFLPQEMISAFADDFSIGEVIAFKKIEGGMVNKPFLLETASGKYVLRQERRHTTSESITYVDSVTTELRENDWPALEMLPAVDGKKYVEYRGRKFTLSKYEDGYILDWVEPISQQRLINIAEKQATFHRIMSGFVPEGRIERESTVEFIKSKEEEFDAILRSIGSIPAEELNEAQKLILENYNFIKEQFAIWNANLDKLGYANLPKSVIHGDYTRKNFILVGDEVILVIDYDGLATNETRVYDVARSLHNVVFAQVDASVMEEDMRKFEDAVLYLQTYHNINPLTEEEIRIIPEMYRTMLLHMSSWLLSRTIHVEIQDQGSLNFYRGVLDALRNLDNVNWDRLLDVIQP